MIEAVKDWGKGINKDQPPHELAPGFWSDGQNVRFRNGKAEFVGGIASVITPSVAPYALVPYSSGAVKYLAYLGLQRAYVNDGASETEITRRTLPTIRTVTIANVTSNVCTISTGSDNPNVAIGDKVTLSDFVPAYFNVTEAPITAVSSTSFSFVLIAANGSATTLGTYGVDTWAAGVTSTFTGAVDDKWSGGNFNGVLFANSPVDGPYYYDQLGAGYLHKIPRASFVADFCRTFKEYLFFGAPTISGTKYRHQILWGAVAEAGSVPVEFTASDTNDAGEVDQVSDGGCVDGLAWGEYFFLYKRDRRVRVSFIGGNDVFGFQQVQGDGDDGALAVNCIANTPKGQVYLTDGLDVRIHEGGISQSIVEGSWKNWLAANVDPTYRKRSFLVAHSYKKEVWICFPTTGSTTCNYALVWNWDDNAIGVRSLASVTCGCSGELPDSIATTNRMMIGTSTPKIGLADSGTTDFGSAYTQMLERTGMDFDTSDFKTINASMPRFEAATAFTATVYHGASFSPDGAVTYSPGQVYTHKTTQRVMSMSQSGRFLAWKVSMTASDTPTLRTIDFDLKKQGGW